jgi:uncharacterized delta-60 repeat protein
MEGVMGKIRILCLVCCAFVAPFPCQVAGAQGELDVTFNPPNGYVLYRGWNADSYMGLAVQGDAKILVSTGIENGANDDVGVLRYNRNGTLDEQFGNSGLFSWDGGNGNDCGRLLAIQPDGKIVLTGYTHNGENYDVLLMRLNADGTLDTGFGTNGVSSYNNGDRNDYGRGLTLQSDGKIVMTARSTGGGTSIAMMMRYGTDGRLDRTFGTNGVVTYESEQGNAGFRDLIVQGDGKIVTAGYTRTPSGFLILTARYTSDGTLDMDFGTNGTVTYDGGYGNAGARGIVIQPDGGIVVSGANSNGTDLDVVVLRYRSDGTLDTGFGTGGVVTYDGGEGDDNGRRLALAGDGKVIVAGNTFDGSSLLMLVLRYNNNGTPDVLFGGGGAVILKLGGR